MAKLTDKEINKLLQITPYHDIKTHFLPRDINTEIRNEWGHFNEECTDINKLLHHHYREYQRHALIYFMYRQETHHNHPEQNANHLLFDMATGSGKTDLMAGIILYMYLNYNINKFIYTIPYTDVLDKTVDNFIDNDSKKFLFKNNPLYLSNGQPIFLTQVPNINPQECSRKDTIYICLQSIQSLRNAVESPKENGLTLNDLKTQRIVILEDEAHHYNGFTKKTRQKSKVSYEQSLNRISDNCKQCWQLGFTATPNQNRDPDVAQKDSKNIIYYYPLKKFINDGYSKNIYNIATTNSGNMTLPEDLELPNDNKIDRDDVRRMVGAIVLSQFRRKIANNNGINNFWPLILFHSNQINRSLKYTALFNNLITSLTPTFLHNFIHKQLQSLINSNDDHYLLTKAYQKLDNFHGTTLQHFCNTIKNDFNPDNVINVNNDRTNPAVLNHLEDNNVTTRVIFEVSKLNEGWDVLNLFDIVRLDDNSKGKKSTNREVQLIGRGSRYYPFTYSKRSLLQGQNSSQYKRCFDSNNLDDPLLRLLESLFYHTQYDNKYINNLRKSYKNNDFVIRKDRKPVPVNANVKSKFTNSQFNKHGYVYSNLYAIHYPEDNITPEDMGLPIWNNTNSNSYKTSLKIDCSSRIQISSAKDMPASLGNKSHLISKPFHMKYNLRYKLLESKVMINNPFYDFNNLHKFLPKLRSLKEFMKHWLPKIKFEYLININQSDVPSKEILINKFLIKLSHEIKKWSSHKEGTNYFYPIPVKDVVQNYTKYTSDSSEQNSDSGKKNYFDIKGKDEDWFVYNKAINDSVLERNFILNAGNILAKSTNNNHTSFFMIRNDGKAQTNLYLHTDFVNYMPDYILVFQKNNKIYEFYAEPKDAKYLDPMNPNYDDTISKDKLLQKITPNNIHLVNPLPTRYCKLHKVLSPKIVRIKGQYYYSFDGKNPVINDESGKRIKVTFNDGKKNSVVIYGLRFYLKNNMLYTRKWLKAARNFQNVKNDNSKNQINLFNL